MIGQSYWSRYLADILQDSFTVSAVTFDKNFSLKSLLSALVADVILRVGFRPGARTWRGVIFDFIWVAITFVNRNGRCIYYWLGTDVLNTTIDNQHNRLNRYFLDRVRSGEHICCAPWLADELTRLSIQANNLYMPLKLYENGPLAPLPDRFTVLTYIPDSKFAFYGGQEIVEAARKMPEVNFVVVGGNGIWLTDRPENLKFLGWQSDMPSLYRNATVILRLVEHDAFGGNVLEALLHGRHVVYSRRTPHSLYVPFGDCAALMNTLTNLKKLHDDSELELNVSGRDFILAEFDTKKLCNNLKGYLNGKRSSL